MGKIRISFVISDLSEEDIRLLAAGYTIVAKMILTPDDHSLFRYNQGDLIQVETEDGNRLWCQIENQEKIQDEERVIVIFTLSQAPAATTESNLG